MPDQLPVETMAAEWQDHLTRFDDGTHALVRQLAQEHSEQLAAQFYAQMLEHPASSAFLSHEQVRQRLHSSMREWIVSLFSIEDSQALKAVIAHQVTIGRVHARIAIPVHLVLRGARLLKEEFILYTSRYGPADAGQQAQANRLVVDTIDRAMEIMSHAYAASHDRNSRSEEGYRLFSLTQNLASERERQRSALLDWENQLMFGHAVGLNTQQLPEIRTSEFGLWFRHKGAHAFEGTREAGLILEALNDIDHRMLPALVAEGASRDDYVAQLRALRDQVRAIVYHLDHLFERNNELESGRDVLTRLLNRKFLPVVLSRQISYASRHQQAFALLAVDIDHFKAINDTWGHEAGDAVLKQLAVLLIANSRAGDYLFRMGGEEFLLLLVDVNRESALSKAEKLRELVERETFVLADERTLQLTISAGLAMFDGHPDYQRQLSRADQALYRAKHNGRNCLIADGG